MITLSYNMGVLIAAVVIWITYIAYIIGDWFGSGRVINAWQNDRDRIIGLWKSSNESIIAAWERSHKSTLDAWKKSLNL